MTREMFYSFENLDNLIKDFKKDSERKPLQFREVAYFKYDKDMETFSFEFKHTLDSSYSFSKCACGSRFVGRPTFSLESTLQQSNKSPVPIKLEKWNNLQSLLEYIPTIYHGFYKNMIHPKSKGKKAQKAKTATTKNSEPGSSNSNNGANVESDGEEDLDDNDLDSHYDS
ncbi:unnamed protein product [Psylliodes chrysocephalus]|uniref:Uncharacterized protein n=1 Tax=Psylliodes chrysocephalus TaxID=3402493 RepID=A0A9P0C9D7_9CUCU|nr:unnamed protein product [Psylliodes chrysocephala]